MKKTTINLMLCSSLLFGFTACNESAENKDSVETAEDMNEHKEEANTNTVAEDDAEFAVMAANAGMTEVELGKLAAGKASDQRVKDFAQMMVKDHEAANSKLMALATAKKITLPTSVGEDEQKHMTEMQKKTGKEFDKHYMDMMVDDHGKVVDAFKKASTDAKDADIRAFATETLPTLTSHHEAAKTLRDNLKK